MADNIQLLVDAPLLIVQLLIDGLLIGAIFAVAAYGMALVWGVMNVINVVQGELVMLGGFIAFQVTLWGVSPFWGVPAAALVVGAVGFAFFHGGRWSVLIFVAAVVGCLLPPVIEGRFMTLLRGDAGGGFVPADALRLLALVAVGFIIYAGMIRRVTTGDIFLSLLATFGLSILLQQLMNQVWGSQVRTAQSGLGTWFLFDYQVTVSQVKLVAFAGALALGVVLVLFLRRTRLGQAIRATAQNPRAARVLGIDTGRVYAATYAINAALCGAAGAFVVMAYSIHPYMGLPYTVRSFMIVVVAGLGNLPGVIAAGLGLGAAETMAGFVLGVQFQVAFVFCLLIVVLVLRSARLDRQRRTLR